MTSGLAQPARYQMSALAEPNEVAPPRVSGEFEIAKAIVLKSTLSLPLKIGRFVSRGRADVVRNSR